MDTLQYSIIQILFKQVERFIIWKNYRPISLLTGFPKIFEMSTFWRIKQRLVNHNILVPEHYGFRDGVSTDNATYKITEIVFNVGNKKEYVASISCDVTKAFVLNMNYYLLD